MLVTLVNSKARLLKRGLRGTTPMRSELWMGFHHFAQQDFVTI